MSKNLMSKNLMSKNQIQYCMRLQPNNLGKNGGQI